MPENTVTERDAIMKAHRAARSRRAGMALREAFSRNTMLRRCHAMLFASFTI